MNRALPGVRIARGLIVFALAGQVLSANAQQVDTRGAAGINHSAAHAAPYSRNGAGVPIGIIEVTDVGNLRGILPVSSAALGPRLLGQWNFDNLRPAPALAPPVLNPTAATAANHGTLATNTAVGPANGIAVGVAPGANIAFGNINLGNQAGGDAYHDSFRAATDWMQRNQNVRIFNGSFGIWFNGPRRNNFNGTEQISLYADYFQNARDALIITSAANNGVNAPPNQDGSSQITMPADNFNGIAVGALDRDMARRADYSSYWLNSGTGGGADDGTAPDIRCKPDIVAPGSGIGDGVSYAGADANGTSFASPAVAGAAALLVQNGIQLGNPGGRLSGHHTIKAILLNSARKRGISGHNQANFNIRDNLNSFQQASDDDYLNGNTLRQGSSSVTVPVANPTGAWNPARWTNEVDPLLNRRIFKTTAPLDDELGAGALDATRALIQSTGGAQQVPGNVNPIGWDVRQVSAGFEWTYTLNQALQPGDFITATLAYDRTVTEVNSTTQPGAQMGQIDFGDTYTAGQVPVFWLEILYQNNVIARSMSTADNLQHLNIPVADAGNALDYAVKVTYWSGGSFATEWSVAWWTVPAPGAGGIFLAGLLCLGIRRR